MCVQTKAKQKASAFLRDDSDDEDSKKRIVKSHADKRYEELVEIVKALKNAMKVNDWNAIHDRDLPRHGGLVRARALIRNTTPSRALQERSTRLRLPELDRRWPLLCRAHRPHANPGAHAVCLGRV